jgi:hypothetical protein
MAFLTLGDYANGGGYPSDPRRGLLALHQHANLDGWFDGGKKKKKKRRRRAAAAQKAHDDAIARIRSVQATMESNIGKIQRAAGAAKDQAFAIQDMSQQVDHPSAFSLAQEAQDAAYDIDAIAQEAQQAFDDFEYEYNAKRAAGGLYGGALLTTAENTSNTIQTAAGRIARASSVLAASVGRLQSLQRSAAEQAAARAAEEQARRSAAEEARQYEHQLKIQEQERLAALEAEQRAREEAARQAELEFQQLQIEEQRRLAEMQAERERAERERIAQIEERRMEAELRREEAILRREADERAAAERRARLQEAAALRAEEAAIRREEREAQLQQLMMIQELASSGLPAHLLPAGLAPPQPMQQPGLTPMGPGGQFVMPGFQSPPGFQPTGPFGLPAAPGGAPIPTGAWSPYGQVVPGPGGPAPTGFAPMVPGVALASPLPGMPFPGMAPPGYADGPMPQPMLAAPMVPPAMQQPFPQQPAAPAPTPGFAWQGFDPGAEMFGLGGMGDIRPSTNPNLPGALIEENWIIRGPDADDRYTILRPNGQVFNRFTEDQLFMGAIRDPQTNAVIFIPPKERPQGSQSAAAITSDIASVLREAIKATGSVLSEQERRKAAKEYRRAGSAAVPPSLSIPGGSYTPTTTAAPRASTGTYVALGMAGMAAAFFFAPRIFKAMGSKKGKKK